MKNPKPATPSLPIVNEPSCPPNILCLPDCNKLSSSTQKSQEIRVIEKIKRILLENPEGVTVEKLATETKSSQSHIYVLMTGKAHDYIENLKKIRSKTWAICTNL